MLAQLNITTTEANKDYSLLYENVRNTFLWIFIALTTLSLIGNSAAIITVCRRNYRAFQKTCIISLALSDILATVTIATNNIITFVLDDMSWPLGSFLCSFLPMCQMTAVLASSLVLMIIAMDRYRNVVHALSKRWNPRCVFCLGAAALCWIICFVLSLPMYYFYDTYAIPTNPPLFVCLALKKKEHNKYYIFMVVIIFCPLFIVFIWFYYQIAALVWKHRKPVSHKFNKTQQEASSSSKSWTDLKNLNKPKTQEDIRVERKIRTFRIIVALMVVFIVCRLPYFTMQILKTSESGLEDTKAIWYLIFSLLGLHIVNCMLNPLLYTFLNHTLKVWNYFWNSIWEVCCFCCPKDEFESFEKENPFAMGEVDKKKKSQIRFEEHRY